MSSYISMLTIADVAHVYLIGNVEIDFLILIFVLKITD